MHLRQRHRKREGIKRQVEEKRMTEGRQRVWNTTKGHLCDKVKKMKRDNTKWQGGRSQEIEDDGNERKWKGKENISRATSGGIREIWERSVEQRGTGPPGQIPSLCHMSLALKRFGCWYWQDNMGKQINRELEMPRVQGWQRKQKTKRTEAQKGRRGREQPSHQNKMLAVYV